MTGLALCERIRRRTAAPPWPTSRVPTKGRDMAAKTARRADSKRNERRQSGITELAGDHTARGDVELIHVATALALYSSIYAGNLKLFTARGNKLIHVMTVPALYSPIYAGSLKLFTPLGNRLIHVMTAPALYSTIYAGSLKLFTTRGHLIQIMTVRALYSLIYAGNLKLFTIIL